MIFKHGNKTFHVKWLFFCLIMQTSFISFGQMANDSMKRNAIKATYARTYFGDEQMWGNSIFIGYGRNITKKFNADVLVGFTDGVEFEFKDQILHMTLHSGQEIAVNLDYILYQDKLMITAGIGGLYRFWKVTSVYGKETFSGSSRDNQDSYSIIGRGSYSKYRYIDAQVNIGASYPITKRLGIQAEYSFQGNYITHLKIGLAAIF